MICLFTNKAKQFTDCHICIKLCSWLLQTKGPFQLGLAMDHISFIMYDGPVPLSTLLTVICCHLKTTQYHSSSPKVWRKVLFRVGRGGWGVSGFVCLFVCFLGFFPWGFLGFFYRGGGEGGGARFWYHTAWSCPFGHRGVNTLPYKALRHYCITVNVFPTSKSIQDYHNMGRKATVVLGSSINTP